MNCPDCKTLMKRKAPFYVCPACGLSVKPEDLQVAFDRSRKEVENVRGSREDDEYDKKKKRQKDYLNWWTSDKK